MTQNLLYCWRHFGDGDYQPVNDCTHESFGIVLLVDSDIYIPNELVCPKCKGMLVLDEEKVVGIPTGTVCPLHESPA